MKRSFQPAMTAVMRNWTFWTGLLTLVVGMISIPASMASATILVPGDLEVGDTYHLAFVTDGKTTAESTNIADYNAFVNLEASATGATTENYGINWYAIGSTALVDARDNAVVSGPVYLLNETQIAEGYTDMWDGSLSNLITVTQYPSVTAYPYIWTGSTSDGSKSTLYHLGTTLYPLVRLGSISTGYYTGWLSSPLTGAHATLRPLYALSEALTVPIPEPSTGLLSLVGLAGCILARSRRRSARG